LSGADKPEPDRNNMEARFGRYRLLAPLAVGGTAELTLAEDTEGDSRSPCVVKRLLPHMAHHPEAIDLFLRDARLALKCAHPNVRQVYACGEIDGERFIALEYVVGADLRALVDHHAARGAPLPLGPAIRILLDALAALGHIHAQGVVHGDVGPRNLLVGDDGVTKLCDFGVAVEGPGETEPRGTWAYMAPERIRGEPIDPRSDLFSIAVVLWELAAGRRLFKRDSTPLTMLAVVEQPAPPLPVAGLEPLDRVVRPALAKLPADRPANAEVLARDLEQAAGELHLDLARSEVAALVRQFLAG
jgi:serine/threonine protein kinase